MISEVIFVTLAAFTTPLLKGAITSQPFSFLLMSYTIVPLLIYFRYVISDVPEVSKSSLSLRSDTSALSF